MKVLIVSPCDVLSEKDGGTQLISDFAMSLSKRGHHVGLVIPSYKNAKIFFKNIEIYYIPSFLPLHVVVKKVRSKILSHVREKRVSKGIGSTYFFTAIICIIQRYISSIDFLFKRFLTKLCRSYKIIICMFPWLGQQVISTVKDKPVIIFEHNVEWKNFNEFMKNTPLHQAIVKLVQNIEINALSRCHHVFCVSNLDFQELSKYVSREKLSIIPTGIPLLRNVNHREIDNLRQKLGLRGKSIVLFMGSTHPPNIIAVKNIIKIIAPEVLKKAPNTIILIIGTCSNFFSSKLTPKNVMLIGYVDDLVPYLKLADLFINPDTTLSTGLPTKMFYYMSTGKPIITTRIGARGIYLASYENLIVENDVKEYADKIIDALAKLNLESKSKSSLETALNYYSSNVIVKKCEDVFEKLNEMYNKKS